MINKARGLLRKHNKEQDAPSKDYGTKKIRVWLEKIELPTVDRMEMNILLEDWKLKDAQILKVESELVKHYEGDKRIYRLTSIPGISTMGTIVLLSRIGDIKRFKTADSLANYFGLTPGCRNSGKATQRLGGITKAGSSIARRILNHAVVHVTRKCEDMKAWHKKIKSRRGAKTARVAVMRKLATIVWGPAVQAFISRSLRDGRFQSRIEQSEHETTAVQRLAAFRGITTRIIMTRKE